MLSANMKAFLRAIRLGEGTSDDQGYSRLCGGGEAKNLNRHPAYDGFIVSLPKLGIKSTAAGAYQINKPTWESLGYNKLTPFDPDSQDVAAYKLIARAGAVADVDAGRIAEAVHKCRKIWASLPGAGYGQREESLSRVVAEYEKNGGVYTA
jgi:muramidase (phage lysozyme)